MASAGVRAELECSICLSIFTDPVNLTCGHNFCCLCIGCALDAQEGRGVYSCPECRETFHHRPVLQRNVTLRNVVEAIRSPQPHRAASGNLCTYCIGVPVSAVKSCLMCEAYMCGDHLLVHSKSPEHVLTDPTASLEKRKCPVHKRVLEYYCTTHAACICMSCSLAGEHRGHKVETFDEASRRKRQELRILLQSLTARRDNADQRVKILEGCRRKVQDKASAVTERVTVLFRDLRRQLEDLEKRALSEISSQEERAYLSLSDLIQQMEIKKDELSRKINGIEELCAMMDPMMVLQESDTGDLCATEDGDDMSHLHHDGGHLDVAGISHMLRAGLRDISTNERVCFNIQEAADIVLDEDTAHSNLYISDDRRTALWSDMKKKRPETPKRFQNRSQALSSQNFSSGQHYWEVDVSESEHWIVGMCYPTIGRTGWAKSWIGNYKEAWCLLRRNNQHVIIHNGKQVVLPYNIASNTVRVYLDYEVGQLSFYDLCDPIRHLHTFTDTFTQPLHAALWLLDGCVKILGGRI